MKKYLFLILGILILIGSVNAYSNNTLYSFNKTFGSVDETGGDYVYNSSLVNIDGNTLKYDSNGVSGRSPFIETSAGVHNISIYYNLSCTGGISIPIYIQSYNSYPDIGDFGSNINVSTITGDSSYHYFNTIVTTNSSYPNILIAIELFEPCIISYDRVIDYGFIPYQTENITFLGSQSIVRYLKVPSNTILTNAYLNLSGYSYDYTNLNCYQESANTTNQGGNDGVCNLNYTGYYNTSGKSINITYNKPVNGISATWRVKDGNIISNLNIPSDCFNANPNFIRLLINHTATDLGTSATFYNYCWNGTGFKSLGSDGCYPANILSADNSQKFMYDGNWSSGDIYPDTYGEWRYTYEDEGVYCGIMEEAINWTVSGGSNYPTNPSIFSWSYFGTFNQQNNKTNNLASSINSYLSICSYINGFCNVPFTFHSDSTGILRYFGLIFNNVGFLENSQTFNQSTYVTKSENFILNTTYDSNYYSSISATLNYNGTSYLGIKTGSGDSAIFTKTLTIPNLQAGNQTFYWTIALTNSTGVFYFNSTFQNQTINNIVFARCNSTYYNPILVNFTIRDEINTNTLIDAVMKATFYYSLDASYSRTYSVETEANSTFQFCSNYNATFNVKSTIQLNNDNYIQRTYDLINNFTNDTTQKNLYMLSGTNGTNIIVEVKDSGNNPLPNYFVEIYRYYPETDSYFLVVGSTTDLYGQFSARLIENIVKYKFIFKDSNGVIKKTSEGITINCRATICVLPFIIEDTTDFFEEFNQTSYDWSFTFDNNTNIFTFSWNDVSGVSATSRLLVERIAVNGSGIICNSTSTATSGSITCDVGDSSSGYIGQIFRRINGIETRVAVLNINVGHEARDMFGREGLMWCFFLFMTLISVGVYKPPIGIVLFLLGSLALGLIIPITYLTGGILIAEFVIGCIFIWAFKG